MNLYRGSQAQNESCSVRRKYNKFIVKFGILGLSAWSTQPYLSYLNDQSLEDDYPKVNKNNHAINSPLKPVLHDKRR